jgi:hypothetical protein
MLIQRTLPEGFIIQTTSMYRQQHALLNNTELTVVPFYHLPPLRQAGI